MTQDQLDNIGFALVIARTSCQQMSAIATAFQQPGAAAEFAAQEKRFEAVQVCIRAGVIKADESGQ